MNVRTFLAWTFALASLLPRTALAQIEPPPLPPEAPAPHAPEPPPLDDGNDPKTPLGRYQVCFQKMVDAAATDNNFMKRCLGTVSERPRAKGVVLTTRDVRTVVKERGKEIEACYTKLLQQTKDLGVTPEGLVQARLVVEESGKVGSVAFDPTTMTDVALLGCIRERLRGWTFPKTLSGDTRMALGLRLLVKNSRTATVTLAKGSPKLSGSGYGLTSSDILTVFRNNASTLRRCYDELQKRAPGAAGRVTPRLAVTGRGRVDGVSFDDLTVGDAVFKSCLTKALKSWRFPHPVGGEAESVAYPAIDFAPQAAPPPKTTSRP